MITLDSKAITKLGVAAIITAQVYILLKRWKRRKPIYRKHEDALWARDATLYKKTKLPKWLLPAEHR